ncbi:J domain-containing protein [Ralstonia sp. ASV6]|uniref:J domain-containing protein n=1 Tax=Ralstonia sp. ASV6 TaxID=2795124 RepID=UPI0018EC6A68|nr:J domain-containing protein [Ralstonia sp. ASV6]
MTDNYYGVLGVRENASAAEIKSAYRQAAAQVHPVHDNSASYQFSKLAQAYAVLGNDTARNAYDLRRRSTGPSRYQSAPANNIDPEDTFARSMVEWAVELRGQGSTAAQVHSRLVSHRCPASIADAVAGLFDTSTHGAHSQAPAGAGPIGFNFSNLPVIVGIVGILGLLAFFAAREPSKPRDESIVVPSKNAPVVATSTPAAEPRPFGFLTGAKALKDLDAATGAATRAAASFRFPKGNSLPAVDSGLFKSTVAAKIPIPYGSRTLYLLQAVPIQNEQYDCHACAVAVSALITSHSKTGEEVLAGPIQDLGMMGSWGTYDLSSIVLVEVGKKRPGLVFRHSWAGQGEYGSAVEIFGIEGKGLRRLGQFDTGADSTGAFFCQEKKAACEKYDVKVRFVRGGSTYFPVELTTVGIKRGPDGIALPTSETRVMKFNGKAYVQEGSDPDPAQSASDAAVPAQSAPGGAP